MRVFRATYKSRRGIRRESNRWYVEIRDAEGRPRRLPAYEDKPASEEYGRKVQRLANLAAAKLPPDATLTRWIEELDPPVMRERLERIGLLDRERAAVSKPLAEYDKAGKLTGGHLLDFQAALKGKGNCPGHIKTMVKRVRTLFQGCGFRALSDIRADAVVNRLREMREREEKPIGIATSNGYLAAASAFCTWAVRNRRTSASPLSHLQPMNPRLDVKRKRRALSPDELRRVMEAARTGKTRGGMTGSDRAVLYAVAASTGLRWSELASLTAGSFDLDADPATVTVEAAYSKRRRDDTLPLRQDLAETLRDYLATRLPSARAFDMPKTRMGADMMRVDLKAARMAWIKEAKGNVPEVKRRVKSDFLKFEDTDGRIADFHSLRHSFCTALAKAGVAPKVAQDLARHSDINLTLSHYSHTLVEDRAEALESLPGLSGPDVEAIRATGTDDGDPCLGVVLASSLASGKSKRLTTGHNATHKRGRVARGMSKGKGPSTLSKPNADGPSQVVEIGGLEPPTSRVRF